MFLKKILNKTQSRPEKTKWIIFVVILILGATLLLRVSNSMQAPARSLLTSAPGLVVLSSLESLEVYSTLAITLPADIHKAELFIVGIYTQENNVFPTGTISLVFTKNNWRFVEIDFMPQTSLEKQLASLSIYQEEKIQLDNEQEAWLITRNLRPRCVEFEDEVPDKCEISKQLLFEQGDLVISVAADGEHATVGEMIEIAKSML